MMTPEELAAQQAIDAENQQAVIRDADETVTIEVPPETLVLVPGADGAPLEASVLPDASESEGTETDDELEDEGESTWLESALALTSAMATLQETTSNQSLQIANLSTMLPQAIADFRVETQTILAEIRAQIDKALIQQLSVSQPLAPTPPLSVVADDHPAAETRVPEVAPAEVPGVAAQAEARRKRRTL